MGEDIDPYRQRFEIKSKDEEDSWKALINLCRVLNETPPRDLPRAIEPILNVEGVLRFLAIDVAVVNSDGYWTRASDYSIYLEPSGMFHIIPHDMNEAFRGGKPGGGPSRGGFGGRDSGPRSPHPVEEAIDVDKDGELSTEEIRNVTRALMPLDINKDGQIDPEEMRPRFDPGQGGPPDFPGPDPGAEGPPGGEEFDGVTDWCSPTFSWDSEWKELNEKRKAKGQVYGVDSIDTAREKSLKQITAPSRLNGALPSTY